MKIPWATAGRSAKHLARCVLWLGIGVVVLGLTCRLLWIASATETGFTTLRLQWIDATWGWVAGSRRPVQWQEPSDQAYLWLNEIKRTLPLHKDDAEVLMGAALVLDNPNEQYVINHVDRVTSFPGGGSLPEYDKDELRDAEDEFEALCKKQCLALAAKATELDPDNVELWRLRALLLKRYAIHGSDRAPRVNNWQEILQEASQHDPDNALYDYIAADVYWEASSALEYQDSGIPLVITDPKQFQRGLSHFKQGQKKPFLATTESATPLIAKFAKHTTLPASEIPTTAFSHATLLRHTMLVRNVWRLHGDHADKVATDGNVKRALAMHRENVHLMTQFLESDKATRYSRNANLFRVVATNGLDTFASKHTDLLTAAEIKDIKTLQEEAQLAEKITESAAYVVAVSEAARQPTGVDYQTSKPGMLLAALISGVTPAVIVFLVVTAMLALGASRLGSESDFRKLGIVGHTTGLVVAFFVTVVVFGLAPANIIPQQVQAWVLTVAVLVAPFALAAWVGFIWLRRRAFKFGFRTMLICIFAFSILSAIIAATRPSLETFKAFPFALAIPAVGWEGLSADAVAHVYGPRRIWRWAALQWIAYYGPYLTVAVWAALIALLLRLKWLGRYATAATTYRRFVCLWSRQLGCAFATLATALLILYLSVTPAVLVATENKFQYHITVAQNPDHVWTKIDQAAERIRNDKDRMRQLRAEVLEEITASAEE